ncbi:MAG: SBBP repeat-containing protein [Bacteroidetes bacterium]|nr:SBBP repeat-containing protein [Bacteroidota bacterium]
MNKQICLIIMLFVCRICNAQTPVWEWAHSGNGNNFEKGNSICSDNSGNVYVTGFFSSPSITFDSITLINSGTWNAFIAKYDSTGAILWAKSPISSYSEGKGIATDAYGNVYVTGLFANDSIIFDSITLHNNGYYDLFLAKFDSQGNAIWARGVGGQRIDRANSVCTDVNGNVLVTGYFISDSLVFDSTILHHADTIGGDIFIAKYDSSGNSLWAKSYAVIGHELGTAITTDLAGNIYMTGMFGSDIVFGTDTLQSVGSSIDIFIAKYDTFGNEQWARSAGCPYQDACNGIATDLNGNVFITGFFYVTSISFGNIVLNNSGGYDVFVAKMDSSGNFLWAKSSVGGQQEEGHGICTDVFGNVYVTGFYASSSVSFGSITLSLSNNPQLFLVKYDANGNVMWAFAEGGNNNDFSNAICLDLNGDIFITGSYQSDSISFGLTTLYPMGAYDVFVAKSGGVALGLQNYDYDMAINIFPNPFNEQIEIKSKSNEPSEVIFYDITSRKLLQQKFTNSVSLNTEQLEKGIYIYEVRCGSSACKKGKLVKD